MKQLSMWDTRDGKVQLSEDVIWGGGEKRDTRSDTRVLLLIQDTWIYLAVYGIRTVTSSA